MKKFLKDLGALILTISMVFAVVYMLIYSLDNELEIIEQQDRDYQEYIQRESIK